MVSLNETLRHVTVLDSYGPCGDNKTDDKPFLHRHQDTYYLSWGCFYGTSSSVYGPYQTRGSVVDTASIAPDFRMPAPAAGTPWYLGEDYTDRHGSFLQANGQWYFAANDRSHSGDSKSPGSFRDSVMGYVHYREDGSIEPMVINSTGVGTYDAGAVIQAENFFSHRLCSKLDVRALGFAVSVPDGGELSFPHLFNLPNTRTPTLVLTTLAIPREGTITVSSQGTVVGVCQFSQVGQVASEVECPLQQGPAHDSELVLSFSTAQGPVGAEIMRLDSFRVRS
eukprot:TRINITY_DN27396_c0_g1_i1.p1 TRINITY_DN27396_c0_g1~~TRINITY_DN27396_c0_g1_i1.p1  ORF type:complete len:281 (+),score=39.09 TRINITY_DN27396_c0_g1_i1:346-1188(+)